MVTIKKQLKYNAHELGVSACRVILRVLFIFCTFCAEIDLIAPSHVQNGKKVTKTLKYLKITKSNHEGA